MLILFLLMILVAGGLLVAHLPGLQAYVLVLGQMLKIPTTKLSLAGLTSAPKVLAGAAKAGLTGAGILAVSAAAIFGAQNYVDSRYSLSENQVRTLSEHWEIVERVGRENDLDPFVIAATWGTESALGLRNPTLGIGLFGFYWKVVVQKTYWFQPGVVGKAEFEKQVRLVVPEILGRTAAADRQYLRYHAWRDDSSAAQMARCRMWGRYHGSGCNPTNGAIWNNYPGDSTKKGLTVCDSGKCVTMQNNGYESYYARIQALIFSAKVLEAEGVGGLENTRFTLRNLVEKVVAGWQDVKKLSPSTIINVGPIAGFKPELRSTPDQVIKSYNSLPRPAAGTWGPSVGLMAAGTWVKTQGDHGASYNASCVDLADPGSLAAPVYAPIAGIVTLYTDGYKNSVVKIENPEWAVWLLHGHKFAAASGEWVNAGQMVFKQASVGISTGPHVHACYYHKPSRSYVQAWRYIPGWPGGVTK